MYITKTKNKYTIINKKIYCINQEITLNFIKDDMENLYITSMQYIALYYCNSDDIFTKLYNKIPEIVI